MVNFMIFIELPVFTRVAAGLFDDEALRGIQETLLTDPEAGDVIPGGGGLRSCACRYRVAANAAEHG